METTATERVHMDVFPTEDQIAAWNALSRDEQLAQKQAEIEEAYSSGVSTLTREEIRALGEQKLAELKAQASNHK